MYNLNNKIKITIVMILLTITFYNLICCKHKSHAICSKDTFKEGWILVCKDIEDHQFKNLYEYNKIVVIQSLNLTNKGLQNNSWVTELHLHDMPQINDSGLRGLINLEYLYLEKMPNISEAGLLDLKKLNSLYLWNMTHIKNKTLAKLREKGIKITDARYNKRQNFTFRE